MVGQQIITRTSDLDAFLDHICEWDVGGDVDHRAGHDFSMAVTVQPVDEHFKLVGEPFSAVTESISRTSLAIIHMRAVTDRFLRITLRARGREIRMILKVTRCCPQGMHYDIAGDFC